VKVRFLIDENLPPRLKLAILRLNSEIDILRVGEDNAPPTGTLDPDILRYLQLSQRVLVTDNRVSMPGHLELGRRWSYLGFILVAYPNTNSKNSTGACVCLGSY
jgi:Domain of unknown function (DUF5615)